jgi:cystathionine beta-lyase family protein involved in aluminum resistance
VQAVKGSHLIAAVMAAEGFEVSPVAGASRHDVITSIVLRSPARQARTCLCRLRDAVDGATR